MSTLGVTMDRQTQARRRVVVRDMTRDGATAEVIAKHLGVGLRTVYRIRGELGINQEPSKPISPEEDRFIRMLLDDGCPMPEIARTVGRNVQALQRRYRGQGSYVHGSLAGVWRLEKQLGLV